MQSNPEKTDGRKAVFKISPGMSPDAPAITEPVNVYTVKILIIHNPASGRHPCIPISKYFFTRPQNGESIDILDWK